MSVTVNVSCACGEVAGTLRDVSPKGGNRLICYCRDCQAFAHYLEKDDSVLDAQGGTDIFQTKPSRLTFTKGQNHIRSVKVTPKGIYRWYADCCRSPIGNTASTPDVPFVGLITAFISDQGQDKAAAIGPVRGGVNQEGAHGDPSALAKKVSPLAMAGMVAKMIGAKLKGDTATPFFDEDKNPLAEPTVLSAEERAAIDARIDAA